MNSDTLLWLAIALGAFNLLISLVKLVAFIRYLFRADEMLESSLALIEASKAYAKASDIQSRVMGRAMQEAKTTTPALIEAVEKVPEATAVAVVDKLKSEGV